MSPGNQLQELTPVEVHDQLLRQWIVLIDVREPQEYANERISGAMLFPLSAFDPHALPVGGPRRIVFQCGTGKRSAMAVAKCLEAGVQATNHLKGGLQAWKAADLPTLRIDAATGAVLGQR